MPNKSIILVGPMGAGKSTIGKLLAGFLDFTFKDSDRVIEERTGADIPWIFDVEGEEGFRARERAVLETLVSEQDLVLATGGGAVVSEASRARMKRAGKVVYLTAGIEQLVDRTKRDKKRPLLHVDNPEEKIRELIEVRHPLYQEVADFVISTDGKTPKAVAHEIETLVRGEW